MRRESPNFALSTPVPPSSSLPSPAKEAGDVQTATSLPAPYASYSKGVFFCVAATVLMGIQFPVMTDALERIDPFTFTSLRYLIAGILFLPLLWVREGRASFRFERGQLVRAWLLGSVGFCGFGSFVFLASSWPERTAR
jgi:EamA-like transporter family